MSLTLSPAVSVLPEPSLKHRIPSLDGLRAISIFLVLISHSESTYPHQNRWVNFLLTIFGNGSLGVLIFFVISGFLITTLLLNEYEKTGTISLTQFYLRRAFRIFPAFYCYLSFIFGLWMIGIIHLDWLDFGAAALFLRNYGGLFIHSNSSGDWFIAQTWSLAVEEQFYWLWPVCLLFVKPQRAVLITVVLILLAPFIRTAEYFAMPATREQIPIMLHTRMDSLMTGCLIAFLYKNMRFQGLLKSLYQRHIPLLAAVFMFAISALLNNRFRGIYSLPIGWTLENISAALILLWAIDNASSKVGIFLNSRLLTHLGVISYSLYLWQQLFLTKLIPLSFDKFPFSLVLCILAAEFSYFVVERPILSWRQRLKLSHTNATAKAVKL